jgi:hypothetical protein
MDIHSVIADVTKNHTELLGRELGIEIETFGAGLAHVSILKQKFNYLKSDYAELRAAYELTAKQFEKLTQDYECLALDSKDRGDWK